MHPLPINYDSPGELRQFLDSQGLGMRKKYGQNFLINPAMRLMLLDALEIKRGDEVWEIGAGLGAMTAGLLERGALVTAFEIDPAFSRVLNELFGAYSFGIKPSFRLVEGDVLKTWKLVNGSEKELFLFGNLPYNIAAALLAGLIEQKRIFRRMVVTVQKEVAQRMAALPGTSDYSSFSVLCSSVYNVTLLNVIKSSSFYPAPNVDSQGVKLDLKSEIDVKPALFYPLVRHLFSSRRKTMRNNLTSFLLSINRETGDVKDMVALVLKKADINGDRRAETLDKNEFTALAAFLEEFAKHGT